MKKISICVAIAAYKRLEILDLCLANIYGLRELFDDLYEFKILVCADGITAGHLVNRDLEILPHENKPLGKKFDFMITQAARRSDYVLKLDSDDLLSGLYFRKALEHIAAGARLIFLDRVAICNLYTLKTRLVRTEFTGGAVLIKSDLILETEAEYADRARSGVFIWDINQGTDVAFRRLQYVNQMAKAMIEPSEVPDLIDVKSDVNIWPFERFNRFPPLDLDALEPSYLPKTIEQLRELRRQYMLSNNVGARDSRYRHYVRDEVERKNGEI